MRASELIGSPVFGEGGHPLGIVRDIRLDADRAPDGSFLILGLVLSDPGPRPAAAHAWGFAEGRMRTPRWLARILPGDRSNFVPASRIRDWGPERISVTTSSR